MRTEPQLDRRTFLIDLGHGAVAFAFFAIAGCAPSLASSAPTGSSSAGSTPEPTPSGTPASGTATSPAGSAQVGGGDLAWERVNLGFVSAYLLVRGGEAALVDTGTGGSQDAIGRTLTRLGLGWNAVSHVILTHHHGDHIGSLEAVLGLAPDAAAYAGAGDVPAIIVNRPLTAVGDGDTIFDLQVIDTPGHTAGSISVLDPIAGVLVAGDAMGIDSGKPILPGARNTASMPMAKGSIAKLAELDFETLLVGHGDPIESGAAALVAELAAAG